MKKYFLVMIAAVMAITFSSFSAEKSRTQDEYSFEDANGWHEVDAIDACEPGTEEPCEIDNPLTPFIPGDMVQLYKSRSKAVGNELRYNLQ